MIEATPELGLYVLQKTARYGGGMETWISVVNKAKEDGREYVTNFSDSDAAWHWAKQYKNRTYANFEIRGWYTAPKDGKPAYTLGFTPSYFDIYSIESAQCTRMAKTFADWAKAVERWRQENGSRMHEVQTFALLAKFVGAKFIVFQDARAKFMPSSYRDMQWKFYLLPAGINKFASVVEEELRDAESKAAVA